jgi:hypothetical protein
MHAFGQERAGEKQDDDGVEKGLENHTRIGNIGHNDHDRD